MEAAGTAAVAVQRATHHRDRLVVPEALQAFGEYVAAACIPDPAPAEDGTVAQHPPAVLHLRRTVAALARRALGRALS